MDLKEIIRAATEVDGAAPLDEAALMAWHDGEATVSSTDHGFRLVHGTECSVVVHPDHRGRGIGTSLAEGLPPGPLTAWSHSDHPAAARLAARHGFARVRALWVMRRDMAQALAAYEPPADLTIRGYRDSDAGEVVRVNAAAFAAHPEQGAMDEANLARRMAEPWFDPAGLLVADTGSGLAGFHWTKQHSPTTGEVYVVGVDPAAQGRGLGRTLTLAGLHHLAGLGLEQVVLYVESDNEPATRLYSGLGFEHDHTHVQYARRA